MQKQNLVINMKESIFCNVDGMIMWINITIPVQQTNKNPLEPRKTFANEKNKLAQMTTAYEKCSGHI